MVRAVTFLSFASGLGGNKDVPHWEGKIATLKFLTTSSKLPLTLFSLAQPISSFLSGTTMATSVLS